MFQYIDTLKNYKVSESAENRFAINRCGRFSRREKENLLFAALARLIVFVLSFSLIFSPTASHAQSILNLPVLGTIVSPSPAFVPVLLKGMTIHPEDPLKFDFIIDSGNTDFTTDKIKIESERLVKYFLASMTVPKDDLWVNLSPYEDDRIIPDELGKTELGRDMLAQDYILKQLTASLMYPEKELGKKFWDKVYKKAEEQFGTSEIPVNTFNKVWILPESATVYEHEQTVYVVDARMKVMLDSDYMAMDLQQKSTSKSRAPARDQALNYQKTEDRGQRTEHRGQTTKNLSPDFSPLSSEIIREIIIPEIEKEVNEGRHFAPLRQIYHSLILAKWYKETIKNSLLSQVYVDKNKIAGVESGDKTIKDQIYTQYMEAYKKGVFDYIREDYDRLNNEVIPRKYFSGGEKLTNIVLKKTKGAITGKGLVGNGFMLAAALTLAATLPSAEPVFAQTPEPAVSLGQGSLEKAKDDEGVIRKQVAKILYSLKWWEKSPFSSEGDKRALLEAEERNIVGRPDIPDIDGKKKDPSQALMEKYKLALKNRESAVSKEVDTIMAWIKETPGNFEHVEVKVLGLMGEVIGMTDLGIAKKFGSTYGFTYKKIRPTTPSKRHYENSPESSSPTASFDGEKIAVDDEVAYRDMIDHLLIYIKRLGEAYSEDEQFLLAELEKWADDPITAAQENLDLLEKMEKKYQISFQKQIKRAGSIRDQLSRIKVKPDAKNPTLSQLTSYGKLISSSPIISEEEVGGIDLNEIDVDRQGAGVDIQFDPVEIQEIIDLGIDGFAPVIINLTPLPSVLPLLGLEPQRKKEDFELSQAS